MNFLLKIYHIHRQSINLFIIACSGLLFTLAMTGTFSFLLYFSLVPILYLINQKEISAKIKNLLFLFIFLGTITALFFKISILKIDFNFLTYYMFSIVYALVFVFKIFFISKVKIVDQKYTLFKDVIIFSLLSLFEFLIFSFVYNQPFIHLFPFVKLCSSLGYAAISFLFFLINRSILQYIKENKISILIFPFTLYLAFPSYDMYPLAFFRYFSLIAFVPLMLAIRNYSIKKVYLYSFVLGVIANTLTFGWMGSFGSSVAYGEIILLLAFMPTISVILATKFTLAELLSRRYPRYRLFIFPVILLAFDFFQSWGYLAFPWTYIGYSQFRNLSMLRLASVTGIFGVVFFINLVNTLIAYTLSDRGSAYDKLYYTLYCKTSDNAASPRIINYFKRLTIVASKPLEILYSKKKKIIIPAISLLLILLFFLPQFTLPSINVNNTKGIRVSLIQTCISPWENWKRNRFRHLKTLAKETNKSIQKNSADLIIWSESATLETISSSYRSGRLNRFEYLLLDYVDKIDIPLFTAEIGRYRDDAGVYYTNSACLINKEGGVSDVYSKIHLAPIGEWFPYEKLLPGLKIFLESMGSSSFTPGVKPKLIHTAGFTFGPLICYEGMFQRLNRTYKTMGADFLVNITNDGWSSYYSGHMQHYAASPFRAAENGLSYLRVGNTGYTVILDPYGRELESIPIQQIGNINKIVDVNNKVNTLYASIGDSIIWLLFLAAALVMVFQEIINIIGNRFNKHN